MTVRLTRFDQFSNYFNEGKVVSVSINPALQRFAGPGNTILTAQLDMFPAPYGPPKLSEFHGEVQYNPATNEISAPLRTNTNEYACFDVDRRDNEPGLQIVKSDEDMRIYCLEQLSYYGFVRRPTGGLYDIALARYDAMSIDELIQLTLREGNRRGTIFIVKGESLVQIKDREILT